MLAVWRGCSPRKVRGICVHAPRATATTNVLAHNADIAEVQA